MTATIATGEAEAAQGGNHSKARLQSNERRGFIVSERESETGGVEYGGERGGQSGGDQGGQGGQPRDTQEDGQSGGQQEGGQGGQESEWPGPQDRLNDQPGE